MHTITGMVRGDMERVPLDSNRRSGGAARPQLRPHW